MSSNEPRVLIKDGPSKWKFVTNFFTPVFERELLPFTVEDNPRYQGRLRMSRRKIQLNILWIGLGDDDAELFLIKGVMNKGNDFEGSYSTRTRTGQLKF